MSDTRTEVHFHAYLYNGEVLFQFYRYSKETDTWDWDEDKSSAEEALKAYPLHQFKWVSITLEY